ncbi:hypothetical protein [Pseudoxanthomonas beigongshangi]
MTNNPYAPPQSTGQPRRETNWRSTLLVPFLSSMILVPAGLAWIGALRRIPDLFARPDFLLPLIAGSAVAATVLRYYRSANGLMRAFLAPPIGFAAYVMILVILRLAST